MYTSIGVDECIGLSGGMGERIQEGIEGWAGISDSLGCSF